MLIFSDKHFHINTPFYGAWKKYNWPLDDWGFGLRKERIDKLAKTDETIYVSYLKKPQLYTIKAKAVQKYPMEEIGWAKVKVYVIPRSSLNYCQSKRSEIVLEEMKRNGVFD